MSQCSVQIGPFTVGGGARPLVVAEAGINHNGDLSLARALVRAAADAGADIVKFQTHVTDAEMLPDRGPAQDAGSHVTSSLYDIMKQCELTLEDHLALKAEAEDAGILFLSTPFSVEAVALLEKVGVPAYKVGSGEVTNLPFLEAVSATGKPVILSTGTADWEEVGRAANCVLDRNPNLILMQCTSNYPTAYADVNLGVLDRMSETFGVPVGLSDHCTGNYACFGAVARGACIVEKHFTISRKLPGIDQPASIEPHELADLVAGVRAVHAAGGREKQVNDEAQKVRQGFSESIVSLTAIAAGETLAARENVWVKRPGTGIPSWRLSDVVGRRALRDIPANTLLRPEDIENFAG